MVEDYSPKWRDIIRSLYDHIEIKPNEDHWAKKLTMFMKQHKKEIDRLLDSAQLLGQKLQKESVEFVLCHADAVDEERSEMYKQFIAMFDSNGVVDIAFKTAKP